MHARVVNRRISWIVVLLWTGFVAAGLADGRAAWALRSASEPRPVTIDSDRPRVDASYLSGQPVRILGKTEAGERTWVFVQVPGMYPDAVFARPSDERCREEGKHFLLFSQGGERVSDAASLWYADDYPGVRVDLGSNDLAGLGEVIVTVKKGEGPEALSTVQTIRLTESSLRSEAGFYEIEPVSFSFRNEEAALDLRSSPARLWYAFQPADEGPEDKPLFLFFNGGPGCPTTTGLLSYNTGRTTADPHANGGQEIGPNPASWTRLGNLLYVDARGTGLSYNLMESPWDAEARAMEFEARNFNSYLDAADFVRLLLRFLADHPAIRGNPVVIAGESYGGIRATVMLHLLLHYEDYENGEEIYQDPGLAGEIRTHYQEVFPEYAGARVPPQVAAEQFSRQVLIEPLLTGENQNRVTGELWEREGSILYQIAREEGLEYAPCPPDDGSCIPRYNGLTFLDAGAKRDVYDYTKPRDWLFGVFAEAEDKVLYVNKASYLMETDVATVGFLHASERPWAYRVSNTAYANGLNACGGGKASLGGLPLEEKLRCESLARVRRERISRQAEEAVPRGDFEDVFGALEEWDRYLLECSNEITYAFYDNEAVRAGFDIDPYESRYGRLFLENVLYVDTFVTHAAYDMVIYAAAIPGALALHGDILDGVAHDTEPRPGVERQGWIHLHYGDEALLPEGSSNVRTIRFPVYSVSCHSVPVTQPAEFLEDVAAWLDEE